MNDELQLKQIFVKNIDEKIDGVVKASDDSKIADEVREYVLTNEIQTNLEQFLDTYNDPTADYTNGVWISGFFGSGKSHLLKILSHILGDAPTQHSTDDNNREPITRTEVIDNMKAKARQAENHELEGLLDANLRIPAMSLLFNIDSISQKGSKTALMDAFIRVFDDARGYYGANKYVAKLERDLDNNGCLEQFKTEFERLANKPWSKGRAQAAFSGSKIDQAFTAATGNEARDILKDYQKQYNPTIADFADDVRDWLQRQPDNFRLIFLVDEVGQFIGTDIDRMLNLQTVTEELFSRTNGRVWVIVTSQEDIDAVVGDRTVRQGLDFTKIKGRFAINLKLSSADAIEVIQKRLLLKTEQGEAETEELWRKHHDELDALFTFQGGGNTRQFRDTNKFGSKEDFTAIYPLINYEFALFQAAMRGMSSAGFFEGQHRSVGERSLLAAISSALVDYKDKPVGTLVPFSALYEGVSGTIQSTVNHRINQAPRELDAQTCRYALPLLKALLLVKHVEGFTANVRNLRILILDRFDENIPELEQHIRDTLDTLERQNYVHRTGDVYEYLTNDEQAIENEIKNVDVEDRQIRSRIGKIISGDILGSPQVNYGQGRQKIPFRYGLSIDGIAQSTQRPITLNIITPMDSAERDAKILQSAGIRDELRVILDDNPLLLRDIYTLERTEKYLKLHANEQGARKRIIDNKRDDLARMQVGLKATLSKALSAATLAYNGATLETTAREDAASVVTEGLQTLIGRLYTNLGMVDGLAYSEKDLPVVLADADANADSATLAETDSVRNGLDLPAQEVCDYVTGEIRKDLTPTVRSIVQHFEGVPYGWPLADTLACLCHLYGAERIHLVLDGSRVPRTDVVKYLTNQKKTESMGVAIPKSYDSGKLKELRGFAGDYLGLTAGKLPADAEEMAQSIKNGLNAEITRIEALRNANGRFAFVAQLDEPVRRLRAVASMPDDWILESFPTESEEINTDRLLDDKEEIIDPILKVLNGVQRGTLVSGLDWITTNDSNFTLASAKIQKERDEVRAIADDPMLFRGNKVNLFNTRLTVLKEHLEAWIGEEREHALEVVQTVRGNIIGIDSYRNAREDAQHNALHTLEGAASKINDAKYIADIRQTADTVKGNLYLALVNRLDAARQQAEVQPDAVAVHDGPVVSTESVESGDTEPKHVDVSVEPTAQPVNRNIRVTPPRPKPMLVTENDVDEFLDEYRHELIAAIRAGKRILL